MAVLMTAQLPGGTKEMIDGMFAQLAGPQRNAHGFVLHANGPAADGWRVTEVWDSQSDFEAWFESYVKPAFPEGAPMPSITFDELTRSYWPVNARPPRLTFPNAGPGNPPLASACRLGSIRL